MSNTEFMISQSKLSSTDSLQYVRSFIHDLRSHLTVLVLTIETTQNLDKKEYSRIMNSIHRINKDIAKLSYKFNLENEEEFHFKTFSLTGFLENEIDYYSTLAQSKSIRLELNHKADKIEINSDQFALSHIIQNLVTNAFKYSFHNSKVILSTRVLDSTLEIVVENQGQTVAKHLRCDIFKPFVRARNDIEGLGLGLSIVKDLTAKLGGEINYQAQDTKNKFTLTLPL